MTLRKCHAQAQRLAPEFSIATLVIEAGPAYFDSAVQKVGEGLVAISAELSKHDAQPYTGGKAK